LSAAAGRVVLAGFGQPNAGVSTPPAATGELAAPGEAGLPAHDARDNPKQTPINAR
jgi:hypothetical protein